jgi:hypothetical protein
MSEPHLNLSDADHHKALVKILTQAIDIAFTRYPDGHLCHAITVDHERLQILREALNAIGVGEK